MFEIVQGSYRDVAALSSVLDDHWEELAKNKKLMVLKPDLPRYEAMENAGACFTMLVKKDSEIIGYTINFLNYHPHYADVYCCYNDLLFVVKEYRGSIAGIRLMKATEQEAKKRNVALMFWHAKDKTTLAKILPRMKYKLQELIFTKEL